MNEVLIRKAKKGDKDAFCRLMDEQMQSMYKIAISCVKNDEDAADAIQDTILSCYENLKSLKYNRYFKTWMIRILINKCKDILQRKNRMICAESFKMAAIFTHTDIKEEDLPGGGICLGRMGADAGTAGREIPDDRSSVLHGRI